MRVRPPRARGVIRDAVERFRGDRGALLGLVVIVAVVALAALAPIVSPYDPVEQQIRLRGQGPSTEHVLGLDEVGRDELSRVLYGARVTVGGAVAAVAAAGILGVGAGLLSGSAHRRVDNVLMRIADGMLAFPSIVLAILAVVFIGPGLLSAIAAVAIADVPGYARLTRGQTLTVREQEFVRAAVAVGATPVRVALRHVLPNTIAPIIVYSSLQIGSAIIRLASLSFLGFGAQPPEPEWGAMLNAAQQWLGTAPHISIVPGAAIVTVVVAFNLVGDGLRDALDPRTRVTR
ncbi:MAG TPA: ABC transporter permease [Candidatus Limnocylindria bacterium]|nr:ABC transporter permease [Candidatus Limnocylindria bacterium]